MAKYPIDECDLDDDEDTEEQEKIEEANESTIEEQNENYAVNKINNNRIIFKIK